jgi:hypothetical protein
MLTGYGLDDRGSIPVGTEIFIITTTSRQALGPTSLIYWALGVKQPESEAERSPPFTVEIKNEWRHTSIHPYVIVTWCLIKHRDNFTFTFGFMSGRKLVSRV